MILYPFCFTTKAHLKLSLWNAHIQNAARFLSLKRPELVSGMIHAEFRRSIWGLICRNILWWNLKVKLVLKQKNMEAWRGHITTKWLTRSQTGETYCRTRGGGTKLVGHWSLFSWVCDSSHSPSSSSSWQSMRAERESHLWEHQQRERNTSKKKKIKHRPARRSKRASFLISDLFTDRLETCVPVTNQQ